MTATQNNRPFHLAFPVKDLQQSESWYSQTLGAKVGRKTEKWVDFDLFGHQLTAHLVVPFKHGNISTNKVDKENVPTFHFGVILAWDHWHEFVKGLKKMGIKFLIEPQIRFKNKPGEQATFFICDPNDHALEFKAFLDDKYIFQTK